MQGLRDWTLNVASNGHVFSATFEVLKLSEVSEATSLIESLLFQ